MFTEFINRAAVYADSIQTSGETRRAAIYADGVETNRGADVTSITFDGGAGDRTIVVRGVLDDEIEVDYGDGSAPETKVLQGTSTNVSIVHSYAAGRFKMTITGDIEGLTYILGASQDIQEISFGGLKTLSYLALASNGVINISSLSGLTLLTTVTLSDNNVSSISSLSTATALLIVRLFGNNIADMSAASNWTAVSQIHLQSNNIQDCSAVQGLSSLLYLRLHSNNISILPSSFPAWAGTEIRFDSNGAGFPTDECLIKLYNAGVTGCSINVAGTNPARTSASDTAVTWLLDNGNTVTVNE